MGIFKSLKNTADALTASPTVTMIDGEMVMEVPKPVKATIIADNDKVTIKHLGALNFMSGTTGDVVINYTNLSGINVVPVNLFKKGYIEFLTAGATPVVDRANLEKHPNVVQIMNLEDTETFENLRAFINDKISQSKKTGIDQGLSSADEILKFKNLLDAGVITEAEFETKKKELLK